MCTSLNDKEYGHLVFNLDLNLSPVETASSRIILVSSLYSYMNLDKSFNFPAV